MVNSFLLQRAKRKTKIVCTLGPASEDYEIIYDLVRYGMNVARLNLSHGTHDEHRKRVENVRRAASELDVHIGVMFDIQGPKIRTGEVKEPIILGKGQTFRLTPEPIVGDSRRVSVLYPSLLTDVTPGTVVFIDDGMIELVVQEISEGELVCSVTTGGILKSRQGVSLQGIRIDLPSLTEKDIEDIRFACELNVDFIALSFTRRAEDALAVKRLLDSLEGDIDVIAKIENMQGIENIGEIIDAADGIMVARGDMGIELPTEEVPLLQKLIISRCNEAGKPVITATQMLDSMVRNPRPTRAEVADVANAIFDGTDAVMLSGETAVGKYPLEVVQMMRSIADRADVALPYKEILDKRAAQTSLTVADAICHATCVTAYELGLKAIISSTRSGSTARKVARFRPKTPIVATTPSVKVARKLSLVWGVFPRIVDFAQDTDTVIELSAQRTCELGIASRGDLVAVTAGVGGSTPVGTNFIKVHELGPKQDSDLV
ncbi:MAG: pyruvate kinase [Limnochordia bacterium]|nr:pyruvate kinase [Limnochordia bacterium]MDD4517521.1 pyruvate kinase [Limnochordia bacterium]